MADWTDPDDPFGGDHTTQTSKSVWYDLSDDIDRTDAPDELTTYTYNLQGRMATAVVDLDNDTIIDSFSKYQYDDSGIRVAAIEQVDANDDGDLTDEDDRNTRTDYLVDHRNPTGYAQVLEEMLDPDGDGTAQATLQKSYTIGHDVFLEAVAANQARRLLKDGHGSTRALVDALGNLIQNGTTPQIYAYDAYGNPIGFTPSLALTTRLYSGEQTDQLTGLQYLRARYYNPATGTFTQLDPFAGNLSGPHSLHKYLYTHGDPVNGIDPSGLSVEFDSPKGMAAHRVFAEYVRYVHGILDAGLTLGTVLPDEFPAGAQYGDLKPDAVHKGWQQYFELKPVSHKDSVPHQETDYNTQLWFYDEALPPKDYHRGTSRWLVPYEPGGRLLGEFTDETGTYYVFAWPEMRATLQSGLDGRGLIYYDLKEKIRKRDRQPDDPRPPFFFATRERDGHDDKGRDIRIVRDELEPLARQYVGAEQYLAAASRLALIGAIGGASYLAAGFMLRIGLSTFGRGAF